MTMIYNYVVVENTKHGSTFLKGTAETLSDAEKMRKAFIMIDEVEQPNSEKEYSVYSRTFTQE